MLAARTDDFGYANLAIRGRKLDGDHRRAGRAGARAASPTWSRSTPAANDILRPSVDIDALGGAVRRRARPAGRRPAPASCCSPPSTPAARRSSARCAAGSRSTTSWSARSPTGTARPSSTSGGMRELPRLAALGHRPDAHGPAGHQRMAIAVLDALGVPHDLSVDALPERRARPAAASLARRTPPGPASASRPGSTAASPAAPPATASRPTPAPARSTCRSTEPVRPRTTVAVGYDSGASCGCSSVGRARPSQGRCREFESRHPLQSPHDAPCRAARHSAHRRCREFESRHPLQFQRGSRQRDTPPRSMSRVRARHPAQSVHARPRTPARPSPPGSIRDTDLLPESAHARSGTRVIHGVSLPWFSWGGWETCAFCDQRGQCDGPASLL